MRTHEFIYGEERKVPQYAFVYANRIGWIQSIAPLKSSSPNLDN